MRGISNCCPNILGDYIGVMITTHNLSFNSFSSNLDVIPNATWKLIVLRR